jgi:glycosyltransferase involved in cell wall biosynthesis
MYNPKVSIIIPVYNGANYLKEAIDSALAQTYKNIEIIVVNDGSNDKGATDKIAKSYGKKIRYFTKENGGVSTALNLAIDKMTGEYFSWLSHDDLYYPSKIEKQISYLSSLSNKEVFLYSNYAVLQDNNITPVKHNHEMLVRKPKYALLRGAVNGITVLIHKLIIEKIGKFDENLKCTQDYIYWYEIMKSGCDFIHMEEVLSVTRLHSNQTSIVSPNVVKEGNELWLTMVKDLSSKDRYQLEGTDYNFYLEMIKFLKTTPYDKTLQHCEKELKKVDTLLESKIYNPKISVIIPFYNRINETINAVKSILNQTYNNLEIILVDDASTNDISKLKKYISKNKNIVMLTQDINKGPAAARNAGIKIATGEYIAFLDSDDEFMPNKLEIQIDLMHKHNLNFSHTAYTRRDENHKEDIINIDISGIVVSTLIRGCTIATPTVIIKRSLLNDNNIYYNENLRIGEDVCFWLEIAKFTEFLFVDQALTIVNINNGSHSMDVKKQIVGTQNIITYLLNDEYYSKFGYDISILCNYFYHINQEILQEENNKMAIFGYIPSGSNEAVIRNEIERLNCELYLLRNSKRWKVTSGVAKIIYRDNLIDIDPHGNNSDEITNHRTTQTIEDLKAEIEQLNKQRDDIVNSKRWVYTDKFIRTAYIPKKLIKKIK